MPPDPPSMGRLRGSHMRFLHKLGNPLPQILDPPLILIVVHIPLISKGVYIILYLVSDIHDDKLVSSARGRET